MKLSPAQQRILSRMQFGNLYDCNDIVGCNYKTLEALERAGYLTLIRPLDKETRRDKLYLRQDRPPPARAYSLTELLPNQCRWMQDGQYCCNNDMDKRSYCKQHHYDIYVPNEKRKR